MRLQRQWPVLLGLLGLLWLRLGLLWLRLGLCGPGLLLWLLLWLLLRLRVLPLGLPRGLLLGPLLLVLGQPPATPSADYRSSA
jgi:hypothetical protein